MTADPAPKTLHIDLTRAAEGRYVARSAWGAEVEFGSGDGLLSPVELLLAAVAGCSSIDVDTVTARRSEPERFDVAADGTKVSEDGAVRLADVSLSFDLRFPDDEAGKQARGLVERVVRLSHDKNCTVSRTIEHGAPVTFDVVSEG